MSDSTTELLIRARGYLERGWCRRFLALDASRYPVSPDSDEAVKWCANGALVAAGVPWFALSGAAIPRALGYCEQRAVRRLQAAIGGNTDAITDIATFNNEQETVEPILAAFDRAIAARTPAPVGS